MQILMNFHTQIYLYDQHPDQETEQFSTPQNVHSYSCHFDPSAAAVTTILTSNTLD